MGLSCSEAEQHAHNPDVISTSGIQSIMSTLGKTCVAYNTHWGTALDVPGIKANEECFTSSSSRTASEYSCARVQQHMYRLCYCSSTYTSTITTTGPKSKIISQKLQMAQAKSVSTVLYQTPLANSKPLLNLVRRGTYAPLGFPLGTAFVSCIFRRRTKSCVTQDQTLARINPLHMVPASQSLRTRVQALIRKCHLQ